MNPISVLQKSIRIIVILMLMPTYVNAYNKFDKSEIWMQSIVTVLFIIDWGQTKNIENHEGIYETNIVLGRNPRQSEINNYMFTGIVLHATVSYILPHKYRKIWQVSWILIEINCIQHNYRMGLKINF